MAFAIGTSAPAAAKAPIRSGGRIALILLAPGLAYLGLFFLTPLISLVVTSLKVPDVTGDIGRYNYGLEFANYGYVISQYLPQIGRSFLYALIATVVALLISYPIAYFIGVKLRSRPLLQGLLLTLVIAPFFISFLLRTFAWKQIFSAEGFIVQSLQGWGVLAPDQFIVGSPFAVVFGLAYNFIPFMTLPLYTNLERLDVRLLEAGSDLYSTPASTFWKITLPISMPGVISGTLLTFIPISGDYINASRDFLGGPETTMLGNVVERNFFAIQDYPSASALSVLLMGAIVLLVWAYVKRSGTEELL